MQCLLFGPWPKSNSSQIESSSSHCFVVARRLDSVSDHRVGRCLFVPVFSGTKNQEQGMGCHNEGKNNDDEPAVHERAQQEEANN